MRIALAQTDIVWENKEANFDTCRRLVAEAKLNNVEIILFPEMSFTGFTMNTAYSAEENMLTVETMKKISKDNSIIIGFGWVKKSFGKAENHYSIISPSGDIISDYVKIHPFSFSGEDRYFEGGTHVERFDVQGIPFSVFICYDLRFPEVFQIASKQAHFIIVPANWPKKRNEHWSTLLRARAIENQVYIIAINCCGENIGGIEYSGDSCVISPNGCVLVSSNKTEMIICDMDDDVDEYRRSFPTKEDRREKLYQELFVDNQE